MNFFEKYIDNAITVCNKIKASDFLAYAYLYKARILIQKNNIPESKYYANESISLLKKWKYSAYYLGMAIISLGLCYLKGGKYVIAMAVFKRAYSVLEKGHAIFQMNVATFYDNLSLLLIRNSRLESIAKRNLSNCYQYFDSIGANKFSQHLKRVEELYITQS